MPGKVLSSPMHNLHILGTCTNREAPLSNYEAIYAAVEELNWAYGRGRLVSLCMAMYDGQNTGDAVACAKAMYGWDSFRVRLELLSDKGTRRVRIKARGHQKTVPIR